MKKTYKKREEKLTSEGSELRQPVTALEAPATRHKQAEQLLGKMEEDKLAILNSISELVAYQDTEHRILWANKAAAESVGLTPAQMVGRYCYEIWPQRSQPCAGCPVAKARQTGIPQETETTTPDGRAWSIRGYPVLDENNCAVGAVEVTLDITERKQAEEALKDSEEFNLSLLVNSPHPVNVINPDSSIRYVNPALEKLTGFSLAELVGHKPPYPYWTEETLKKTTRYLEEGMRHKAVKIEELFQKKSGERFWVEITSAPVIKNGKLNYLVANWVDITYRKRSKERLQKILETALDGFWLTNLEGKLLEVNDSYCKMVGYTRRELLNMYISDLEAAESPPEVAKRIKKAIEQGHDRFESQHKRKDGQIIDVEVSVNYLDVGKGQLFVFARDITERKRAEEALRDSEEKTRKMFESVSDGISVVDLNGVITDTNPRTVEMHSFSSKDNLVGKSAFDIVAPTDREKIARNMRKALKRGTVRDQEYTLLKSDGSEFPAELSTSVLKDASGKAVGHITISRDITERNQASEALKESEERYRSLTDVAGQTGEAVVMIRCEGPKDGFPIFFNEAWPKLTGYSRSELLNMSVLELMPPRDRKASRERHRRRMRGETLPELFEMTIIRKDGTEVPVETAGIHTTYQGERVSFAYTRDITERKKASDALRRSEEKYKTIFENVKELIARLDNDGKIIDVNKRIEDYFGYKREEIIGKNFAELASQSPRYLIKIAELFDAAVKNKPLPIIELEIKRKDGSTAIVEITTNFVKKDGKVEGTIAIVRDITQRKQAEEREKELQRELYLSSRLASIGELAAGIAHQINNPLTGVLGFSQRLLRKSTDQTVNDGLKRIYTEAERAAKVVQNLLTFARRRQPQKQYSDINEILESALELRDYEMATSNIEIVTDLTPNLPRLMLDFHQIQEVFLNIILNAEQAITEDSGGGRLFIKTEERKGCIRTTFTDSGPGIAAENLEKVFDPFFSTKGERDGTGLGLSVCHGIISEHGGRIYAKSKPGKGATFFIELPMPQQ